MSIKYSKPVLNPDGTILIEQVSVLRSGEMENGIKKRELKVIQELYPNLELLNETMELAKANYADVEKQGNKTVKQLELEKNALQELLEQVAKLK